MKGLLKIVPFVSRINCYRLKCISKCIHIVPRGGWDAENIDN